MYDVSAHKKKPRDSLPEAGCLQSRWTLTRGLCVDFDYQFTELTEINTSFKPPTVRYSVNAFWSATSPFFSTKCGTHRSSVTMVVNTKWLGLARLSLLSALSWVRSHPHRRQGLCLLCSVEFTGRPEYVCGIRNSQLSFCLKINPDSPFPYKTGSPEVVLNANSQS